METDQETYIPEVKAVVDQRILRNEHIQGTLTCFVMSATENVAIFVFTDGRWALLSRAGDHYSAEFSLGEPLDRVMLSLMNRVRLISDALYASQMHAWEVGTRRE